MWELEQRAHAIYEQVMTDLTKAFQARTVNQRDRAPQYCPPFDQLTPERIIHHVNELGKLTRGLQADKERMQQQLMNLKLRNGIVVAIVTAGLTILGQWLLR